MVRSSDQVGGLLMDLFGEELDRNMPVLSADAVGRALRSAREQLGLSLAEVADVTRMAVRHLEAIEQARFDGFSAPVYALGFARNYARAVGLPLPWITDCLRGEISALFADRERFDLGWTAEGLQHGR
jgi:transcriptional regulator with XRE-family HTH domain